MSIPTNPSTERPSNGVTTIEANPQLMSENAPAIIASAFVTGSESRPKSAQKRSRPNSGRPSTGTRLSRNVVAPMEGPETGM